MEPQGQERPRLTPEAQHYKVLRQQLLDRDRRRCQACDNLITLCVSCTNHFTFLR